MTGGTEPLRTCAVAHREVRDAFGYAVDAGAFVIVLSVESWSHGLPKDDLARLEACLGKTCRVNEVDRFGFIWLTETKGGIEFCLLPCEVELCVPSDRDTRPASAKMCWMTGASAD